MFSSSSVSPSSLAIRKVISRLRSSTTYRPSYWSSVAVCRFEARQKRITVGNEHDYIDLVFYHRLLRCHLLIDLKVRHFQHGDAGQMNFYLNYWRREVTSPEDNPPVGLLLCSDKDQTKVEYAIGGLDHQVFVSRYLVALPEPNEIEKLIERDRALWERRGESKTPEPCGPSDES